MAEYYLISQLPSLDGLSENVPMPITKPNKWWVERNSIIDMFFLVV